MGEDHGVLIFGRMAREEVVHARHVHVNVITCKTYIYISKLPMSYIYTYYDYTVI